MMQSTRILMFPFLILDQLAKTPPPGFARWNGRLVAEALGDVSDDAVWRVNIAYFGN
jgi:hypothetical protein